MLEVEVKIRAKHDFIRNKLQELGYTKGTTVYEKDVYYNSKLKDLKREDKALRIREYRDLVSGSCHFVLNFKGPKIDSVSMSRTETEFDIPSFEAGEAILNGLGFYEAGKVEKTRTYYNYGRIECCLDNVTNLGEFLEIEIMSEESGYKDAMIEIETLMNKLELKMEDSIKTSYLSMLS